MPDRDAFEIKVFSDSFAELADGELTYLIERDRGFRRGDLVLLREWNPGPCEALQRAGRHSFPCDWAECPGFTGRQLLREVGVMTKLHENIDLYGYVVLSLVHYAPVQKTDVTFAVCAARRRAITVIDRPGRMCNESESDLQRDNE